MSVTEERIRPPSAPPRENMVWIEGGSFSMGSHDFYPEETPVKRVTAGSFWIDAYPVTNRAFARFVDDTGWITSAEIAPNPADYPGALPEKLVPASMVSRPRVAP